MLASTASSVWIATPSPQFSGWETHSDRSGQPPEDDLPGTPLRISSAMDQIDRMASSTCPALCPPPPSAARSAERQMSASSSTCVSASDLRTSR